MSELVVGGNSIDSRYDSIEDAINSSNSGDTILINENFHLSNDIKIDHDLTINGNGNNNNIDIDCDYGFQILSGNVKFNNLSFVCENRCTAFTRMGNDEINLELSNISINHRELKQDSFFEGVFFKKLDVINDSKFNLNIYNCSIDYIRVFDINKLTINEKSKIGNVGTKISSFHAKKISIEDSQVNNCNVISDDFSNTIIMNNVSTAGGILVDGNLNINNFIVDLLPSYIKNEEWNNIFKEFNSRMPLNALITKTKKDEKISINITNTNLDYKKFVGRPENISIGLWFNFTNSNVTFINSSISDGLKYKSYILDSNIISVDSIINEQWLSKTNESILNDKKYKFIDAINASKAGDTIKLTNSITLSQEIYIDHDLTIDGNGHTINIQPSTGGFHPNNGNITFNNLNIDLNGSSFIYKSNPGNTSINLNDVKIKSFSLNPDKFIASVSNLQSLSDGNLINLYINHSEIEYIEFDKIDNLMISKNSLIGNATKKTSVLSANNILINDSNLTNTYIKSRNNDSIKMNNVSTFGFLLVSGNLILDHFNVSPLPNQEKYDDYDEEINNFSAFNSVFSLSVESNNDQKANVEIKNINLNYTNELINQQHVYLIGAWFHFMNCNVKIIDSSINKLPNPMKNLLDSSKLTLIDTTDNSMWDGDSENEIIEHRSDINENIDNNEGNIFEQSSGKLTRSMKEINDLIGLKSVKRQLDEFINNSKINIAREKKNIKSKSINMNMVFEGNPGTGKTEVARLFAKALYENGVLKKDNFKEVNASDLVSQSIGGTSIKTHETIMSALDGVLFIDEAYTLAPPKDDGVTFNNEAINQLILDIENNRDRLVVIMAGYQNNMEDFFKRSNPGLSSRFPKSIIFPDYSSKELLEIFDLQMKHKFNDENGNYIAQKCTPEARELVKKSIDQLYEAHVINDNARFIRDKIIENISATNVERLRNENNGNFDELSANELTIINEEDVKLAMKRLFVSMNVSNDFEKSNNDNEKAIDTLNGLTGLKSVKREAMGLINDAIVNKFKKKQGKKVNTTSMNMVFEGNPGTGKTEVARLFSKVLFEEGVLKTGKFTEVKASDLVSKFVGDTALKTKDIVMSALDGVLFIDEAYSLAPPKDGGRESNSDAVTELIADMENNRDRIVVIMAGYKNEMEDLFHRSNPGLASRFSKKILFPDYSSDELLEIFKYTLRKDDMNCTDDAIKIIKTGIDEYLNKVSENENGRFVRNLIGELNRHHSNRVVSLVKELSDNDEMSDEQMKKIDTINSIDAKNAIKDIMKKYS